MELIKDDGTLAIETPHEAIKALLETLKKGVNTSVVIEKNSILQAINRLTLFNNVDTTFAKTYLIFEFENDSATIYDANHFNKETIYYNNSDTGITDKYTLLRYNNYFFIIHLKMKYLFFMNLLFCLFYIITTKRNPIRLYDILLIKILPSFKIKMK